MAARVATLCGFQKVLRRPVRGFRAQGAQKRALCGAIEGNLNTQTPDLRTPWGGGKRRGVEKPHK